MRDPFRSTFPDRISSKLPAPGNPGYDLAMSVNLKYREYGGGSPLVILHGLFGSGRNWHSIAERLSTDHRVICMDIRNHGESPHDDEMNYTAMADDLRALLNKLQISTTRIIGHSMGGKAAMWFALTEPDAIERLIIVDIAPTTYSDRYSALLAAMRDLPLTTLATRASAETHLAKSVPDRVVRKFLMQNVVHRDGALCWRINIDAIQRGMPALMAFPAATSSFDQPCLFIRGANSNSAGPEHQAAIHELFPAATIATIENAGHWPHAERPAEFLAAAVDFLELR
jgi:esterase